MSVSFKFTIYFKVNYQTHLGESVYVLGNIPDLGKWNIENAIKLTWNPGYDWTKKFVFVCALDQLIEYKYVVGLTNNPENSALKWEEGPNRELNFMRSSDLEYPLNDVWNYRKIILRIQYDFSEPTKSFYVVGNTNDLGNFSQPQKMELVLRKDPQTKILSSYWEKESYIEAKRPYMRYYYLIYDEKEKKFQWERDPGRIMNLKDRDVVNYWKKIDPNNELRVDCIYFRLKNNIYKKIDTNFISVFFYNQINENLFIGPYPCCKEDIDKLKSDEIKAVLNLQTSYDMKYRSIEWEFLKNYYEQNQIVVLNFQIIDNDYEDMKNKGFEAAQILSKLVEKFTRVYVHCTAGIGRAPQTTILYLCLYQGYSLDYAIDFVKKKRIIVKPNKKWLEDVLAMCPKVMVMANGNGNGKNGKNFEERK